MPGDLLTTQITSSPKILLQVMILQRRKDLLDQLEWYYKQNANSKDKSESLRVLSSRLISLYHEVRITMRARLTKEKKVSVLEEIEQRVYKGSIEDVQYCVEKIDEVLYDMRLIKLDSIREINTENIEEENEASHV